MVTLSRNKQTQVGNAQSRETSPSVEAKPGPLRTLFGILIKPRATLDRLSRAQRAWAWVPAVLMVAMIILATYAQSYADSYYFYEDQMKFYAQHPEQAHFAPSEPAFAPVMTIVIRIGERLAGLLGSWALWSVAVALVCLFTGQRKASFGAAAKLTLWSWAPYLVRSGLQSLYRFLTHDPIFNPGLSGLVLDNTPPSLGQFEYVMIPRTTRFWGTLLGYLDIYLFWHVALVLIGLPIFTQLPRKWARITVVVTVILWIGLRVAVDFSRYKY